MNRLLAALIAPIVNRQYRRLTVGRVGLADGLHTAILRCFAGLKRAL